MNKAVDLQQIELARLKSLVAKEAQALVDLSDEQDTVSAINGGAIRITFVGRGIEIMSLDLPDLYSVVARIGYLTDTLKELTRIKNYILECAA